MFDYGTHNISIGDVFPNWVELTIYGIEILAIAIIAIAIIAGIIRYLNRLFSRLPGVNLFTQFRNRLARAIILSLEVLIAADVIRTVVLEPTIQSITFLGLLIVVRTFLSWSLLVEIEGRWPWQQRIQKQTYTEKAKD
jgi:uncharacterized membrane protein